MSNCPTWSRIEVELELEAAIAMGRCYGTTADDEVLWANDEREWHMERLLLQLLKLPE